MPPIIGSEGAASSKGYGLFSQQTEAPYIEDVFSTYLYTGNGSTQTITNNIDLAGEGGLVWAKSRPRAGDNHEWRDTVRGGNSRIFSNNTNAASSTPNPYTYNADGYTIGGDGGNTNENNITYASWTFRKAPKFFDVVTYSGTGSAQNIAHNLGSVPGCIIVKKYSDTDAWGVYHTSLGNTKGLLLNTTDAAATSSVYWNNTSPTSTQFTVGSGFSNASSTYVAYLFAHDAGGFGADGSENVISCGSFTTDGSGVATVNLGYEPQLILYKRTDAAGNWNIVDNMRGWAVGGNSQRLQPNTSDAEQTSGGGATSPTATGFTVNGGIPASATAIYIAIRRPMKPPSAGTEVFSPQTWSGNGSGTRTFSTSFNVDFTFPNFRNLGATHMLFDRLRGSGATSLDTASSQIEGYNSGQAYFDQQNGIRLNTTFNSSSIDYVNWLLRRAPGFMDVVCYTGDGTVGRAIPHNLTVAPEMMILKGRNTNSSWLVAQNSYNGGTSWWNYYQTLNSGNAVAGPVSVYTQAPTSTNFYVNSASNTANGNGTNTVAYLFASLPGISKVGSYTGNGSSQTINCGFTSGARFVLIKRTDGTGDWFVWDTARGIVSGDDPYLALNVTLAENFDGPKDTIDPASSGFAVNNDSMNCNVNTATYIFLAIA